MSSHPFKVSVVIPTYNRAAFLLETIGSVFDQTYRDYEVVVADDGSEDDTRDRIAPLRDRIHYVHQEHRGVSAARNLGVREARGEWIAFLDSDDRWVPQALAKLVEATDRYPKAGLIAMRCRRVRPDGSIERRTRGKHSPGPYFTTAGLLWEDTGGVLTPMVRRSLVLDVGGFDESLLSAEDCDLWLRLSFVTTMVGVSEPLLRRRIHDGCSTQDRGLNARMWLRVLEKLASEQPDFVERHRRTFQRARGKEHLRLGRELLRARASNPENLLRARRHLKRSIRDYPYFVRAYRYLLLCYVPGVRSSTSKLSRRSGGNSKSAMP